jgi:hypothetical protein
LQNRAAARQLLPLPTKGIDAAIEGNLRRIVAQAPTGFGKTIVGAAITCPQSGRAAQARAARRRVSELARFPS